MATTLDSAKQRLEQARKAAKSRATRERVGPEWPPKDGMTLEEACTELTLMTLLHGAKVGFGNTSGTADIWCRVGFPVDCDHDLAGMVSFVTSSDVAGAMQKAGQLFGEKSRTMWRLDPYAK